jgi:hypothetical protein
MKRVALASMLILAPITEANAHHPGERIDEVMTEREPAFEATDLRRIPRMVLTVANGAPVQLHDMEEKIVVLSFAPEDCGAPCAAQQALLRQVQEGVNITPMRDMVVLLTVDAAPAPDPEWDDINWQAVDAKGGATEASASFAALSARESDAPMIHVIARGGRHAAIFHGTEFGPVNLILYVNELTRMPMPEPGLLDRVLGIFN